MVSGPGEKKCLKIECTDEIFFQTATIGTNIVSAVVAVIVLHLALGLFIYKVYTWRDNLGGNYWIFFVQF